MQCAGIYMDADFIVLKDNPRDPRMFGVYCLNHHLDPVKPTLVRTL